MEKTKRFGTLLPVSMIAALKREAKKQQRTQAAIVRIAIAKHLGIKEKS